MNQNSLVVWKRDLESKFILGLIIDGILKYVSKTVHTLVMRCPRKPWIIKRLPSKWSEDEKKKAHQALVAFMTSQRRPTRRPNRPPMPTYASWKRSMNYIGLSGTHLN